MASDPRQAPYIWPSWIAGLIAGEQSCWYAGWFRAHFTYDKVVDPSFDAEQWRGEHTALLQQVADEYRRRGFAVRLEDQNKFTARGKMATLGGKPDLIVMKDGSGEIVDVKSGKRRSAHAWQVGIYLWVARQVFPWLTTVYDLRGLVRYADGQTKHVTMIDVFAMEPKILEAIQRVSAAAELPAVRSPQECRFCDIACCAYRVTAETPDPPADAWRLF